ncbi:MULTISPECIES: hypothetical protein [Pseudomonas]|uniref:hypothetical protein n=1 Tax=Pseudomonas TaxID=286 RepID=UPI00398F9C5F
MGSRGYLSFIKDNPVYKNSEKDWHVELTDYTVFWFDLLVNPPEGVDYQKRISDQLRAYRKEVEECNDKRFVYFITSRGKVRFSTKTAPEYSWTKKEVIIHLEVGSKKKPKKVRLPALPEFIGVQLPVIFDEGRFIGLWGPGQPYATGFTVHEFLMMHSINLGIDTEVLYVGSTDDPARRPLKRDHRGYSDSLYGISTAEKDVFVYYNLFKALSITKESPYALHFILGNSMIDEVQKKEEGLLLEHGLIHYFGAKSQEKSREQEYGRLREGMSRLKENYKIASVNFHIEAETSTEYWTLYSSQVQSEHRHRFSLTLDGDQVKTGEAQSPFMQSSDTEPSVMKT